MEIKTGYVKRPGFNARSLLVVAVVVGAVTGGNLLLHRGDPPLGYTRYEGRGFSIVYSELMVLRESDLSGYGSPTDASGTMQASMQYDGLEQFGVIWLKPEGMPSNMGRTPEGALDYTFAFIALSGTQISERGELRTTTKDGHDLVYQTFGVPESGFTIPGIIGSWYCEESERFLMLYLVYVPDVNNPEVVSPEMEQMWFGYLESLVCH